GYLFVLWGPCGLSLSILILPVGPPHRCPSPQAPTLAWPRTRRPLGCARERAATREPRAKIRYWGPERRDFVTRFPNNGSSWGPARLPAAEMENVTDLTIGGRSAPSRSRPTSSGHSHTRARRPPPGRRGFNCKVS